MNLQESNRCDCKSGNKGNDKYTDVKFNLNKVFFLFFRVLVTFVNFLLFLL